MSELFAANIKRTKRAIADAFIELLDTKTFEKITVNDIIKRAETSRSTFYKHFVDKYDLAKKIVTKLVDSYSDILIEHKSKPSNEIYPHTYKYILDNRRAFKVLLPVKNLEIDVLAEIVEGLRTIYPKVFTQKSDFYSVESFYFAYIQFITIYSLILEDEDSHKSIDEYAIKTFVSLTNVFSYCFGLDANSLRSFVDANSLRSFVAVSTESYRKA